MKISPLDLWDAFLIEPERREDERGWFARTFCVDELRNAGIEFRVSQGSSSFNHRRGTIRGMHWQEEPHGEVKIVRCSRGRIYDALVDVRHGSPTFGRTVARELSPENGHALLIPRGFAHGFQTLEDATEVQYLMDGVHVPEAARGARYDDRLFAIAWPLPVTVISERDLTYPPFSP